MDTQKWIEWLDIRDRITCTGNHQTYKWTNELHLARDCDHPEAQWLWNAIGHCTTLDEILEALKDKDDHRSLTYRAIFSALKSVLHPILTDIFSLRTNVRKDLIRAADAGNSFAQRSVCLHAADRTTARRYLTLAIEQGERQAMVYLADRVKDDDNLKDYAEDLYRRAASLGCRTAMAECIHARLVSQQLRCEYLCHLYMTRGALERNFYNKLVRELEYFRNGREENQQILVDFVRAANCIIVENQEYQKVKMEANQLIDGWKQRARDAIDAWTLCAKRMGLYKDVTRLISGLIYQDFIAFSRMK